MKNATNHTGTLEIVERLPTSRNRNPRWLVRIDGWTCATPVDSTLGYSVGNYEGKQVRATIGTHYGRATVARIERV